MGSYVFKSPIGILKISEENGMITGLGLQQGKPDMFSEQKAVAHSDLLYEDTGNFEFERDVIFMKKYKIAAILMIIHGGCMELGGVFCMIPALILGTDKFDIGQYFAFKLPYFQDNLYMMMVMGAMYGVLRLIGAIGLLKNRMWGLGLSVINCVITITLMMFLLPAGIMDGILAGSALVLILMQYFGDKKIIE